MATKITRASTVLKRAKADISQGWCKGDFKVPAGKKNGGDYEIGGVRTDRFCALGAVLQECGYYNSDDVWRVGHPIPWLADYQSSLRSRADEYLGLALGVLANQSRPSLTCSIARAAIGVVDRASGKYVARELDVAEFNDDYRTRRPMVTRLFDVAIDLAIKDEQRERQRRSRAARKAMA